MDDDCVKVVLQFVVKLHAKKGSDLLSKFVHVITTAAYSHRAICDIQELGCHAHHVVSIEVRMHLSAVSRAGGCLKVCSVGSAGVQGHQAVPPVWAWLCPQHARGHVHVHVHV